jgi:hypothetical protein
MENEAGLHLHADNLSNQHVAVLNESEGQVIKTLDNMRGALPTKDSAKVSKRSLINIINHLHFTKEYLWAHIQGQVLQDNLLVKLYPGPCLDDEVILSLPAAADINLHGYSLHKLIVEDGKRATIVPAILKTSAASSITVVLPDRGYRVDARKNKRLLTSSIACEIQQDKCRIQGFLREFSVSGFRVVYSDDVDPCPILLNFSQTVSVRMRQDNILVYEGLCRIIRDGNDQAGHFLVLSPLQRSIASHGRSDQKRIRNERVNLVPTPKVVFNHPISHILLSYEIFDITTSGFSLDEHVDECLLLPGMIIPEVKLLFTSNTQLSCSAQILHARKKGNTVRLGFAIRDMDWTSCIKLCDIIANAIDPHANMNTVNNMDALWEIFFDTGFIYPQKYQYLSDFRDNFKENYRRLYQSDCKDVAFHFTYQENNKIYGHISFIRAYERLWMIHHFAARPMHGKKRVGLEVYKHIFSMYEAVSRLPSSKIDYIMFSFRPSSSFNMFFQAGFCRAIDNAHACSMDLFSYHTLTLVSSHPDVPQGWSVETFTTNDFKPLKEAYEKLSGGLLLEAMGIGTTLHDGRSLEQDYASMGLTRKTDIFALKYNGELKAVFIIDQSDIGLNLSDLLNSIKVIILDQKLPWDILNSVLCKAAAIYGNEQIPVMIYPSNYLESKGISCSRYYYVWILNSKYADPYIQWMKKKININPIKIFFRMIMAKVKHKAN